MRTPLSGLAAIALAASCATGLLSRAAAQEVVGASSAASSAASAAKYRAATKACNAAADAVVWLVPGSKLFFRKGAAKFGKGVGSYVCRRAALAKHARDATSPQPGATPATETAAPSSETTAAPAVMSSPTPEPSPASSPSASPAAKRR